MDKILLLHYLTLQSKTEYRKVGVYKFRAPVRQGKYFFFPVAPLCGPSTGNMFHITLLHLQF